MRLQQHSMTTRGMALLTAGDHKKYEAHLTVELRVEVNVEDDLSTMRDV